MDPLLLILIIVVIVLLLGGTNDLSNLRVAHVLCNVKRGNKTPTFVQCTDA